MRTSGIVKLTKSSQMGLETSEQSRCRDRDLPVVGGFGSEDPKRRSRDKTALEIEGIVDDGMLLRKRWADQAVLAET
jgi:hypothetical protein